MASKKEIYKRKKVKMRIRKTVNGTATRPRLTVFRSNKEMYAQLVDDVAGKTLFAASSLAKDFGDDKMTKIEASKRVGQLLAEKAIAGGISEVVFDRNGYLYHGRVKAVAEGAREKGLKL
jgi:large subunit ribosomal protein L18